MVSERAEVAAEPVRAAAASPALPRGTPSSASRNPHARVFKAGSDTGTDMFNVLYDQAFVDSKVARVKQDKAAIVGSVSDQKLASGLRSAMWNHYVDAVQSDFVGINTKNRHFSVGGYGGVGAEMSWTPPTRRRCCTPTFVTSG